ncbi:MAG TPA: pirin family protein [Candidatus Acidoferrum sp.]|nr:pirin family protein [Candidatus Acidoferrum sp.]
MVPSATRGCTSHDGFTSWRTFSFADYVNPQRTGFGLLRVFNEETLAPGKRVPLHAHENMEIVSIPLSGTLHHRDSRGHDHIIGPGDIHVLSAGLGVTHWEANNSAHEPAHYLQAWIHPLTSGGVPRYRQGHMKLADSANRWVLAASPACAGGVVEVNQQAWVSLASIAADTALPYSKCWHENGLYVFVIEGRLRIGDDELVRGDGLGLMPAGSLALQALQPATVLCIEVPLT